MRRWCRLRRMRYAPGGERGALMIPFIVLVVVLFAGFLLAARLDA